MTTSSTVLRGVDALAVVFTGGASNTSAAASLGGARSTATRGAPRLLGFVLGVVPRDQIPAIRIDRLFPELGEGTGSLALDASSRLVLTPPDGLAGDPVTIAAGESKVVAGADASKAARVYRESGLAFKGGPMPLSFAPAMNGVVGQADLTNAQRVSGYTSHRAIALLNQSPYPIVGIKLWLPPVLGAQATYSIAVETPVAGAVQGPLATEATAPTGLTWSSPTSSTSPLHVSPLAPSAWRAIWIRRAFPAAGTVSPREEAQLAISYRGA